MDFPFLTWVVPFTIRVIPFHVNRCVNVPVKVSIGVKLKGERSRSVVGEGKPTMYVKTSSVSHCHLEYGGWGMEYGGWSMEYGGWSMDPPVAQGYHWQ